MTVTVRSFAKINLGLRIGPARADGFHELLTVYQTIDLHDVIRVRVERGSGIEIRCADPRVPRDSSNTCYRIVERAMEALQARGRVVIEIEKRLPVQGGLGGASANAVATLLALEKALKKTLPPAERLRIAAEVGSDLPLFLVGGTILGVGRGEQVFPLPDFPATACVVVTPEIGVSTPKAFAEWDRRVQGLKPHSVILDAALNGRSSTAIDANVQLKGRSSRAAASDSGSEEHSSTRIADAMLHRHSAVAPASIESAKGTAELGSAGQPMAAVPTKSDWTDEGVRSSTSRGAVGGGDSKLTTSSPSDRMNELGHGLSAWLSEWYSGAPFRRGRAENPLLALDRAGIENDFEQVVFPEYPELGEAKRALVRGGAKYASLSGSGSTLYGLFASRSAAASAVTKLRKAGWAAQSTETLTRTAYWRKLFKA